MKSTAEQLPVIHYEGNHLVVKAYAGCGKTSTLVAYAEQHRHLRMLYLAYNRAIRDEGAAKFPRNVVCKTSHQLAWPGFGQRYQHKLGNIRLTDAAGSSRACLCQPGADGGQGSTQYRSGQGAIRGHAQIGGVQPQAEVQPAGNGVTQGTQATSRRRIRSSISRCRLSLEQQIASVNIQSINSLLETRFLEVP